MDWNLDKLVLMGIGCACAAGFVFDMWRLAHRCPYCGVWFGHRETDTVSFCRNCGKDF